MKMVLLLLIFLLPSFHSARAQTNTKIKLSKIPTSAIQSIENPNGWLSISSQMQKERFREYKLGWSYVISGAIGFMGGWGGQQIAKDPLEKGAYTVFQSIGIAAIGFGLYKVYVGTEENKFYSLLNKSHLSDLEKEELYRAYEAQKKELDRNENRIRALTHGLIALLNINNASQQDPGVARDSLYFIGGVNLLAAASYSFEF